MQYGYYNAPSALHANSEVQEQKSMSRALMEMQKFLGIPVTGEMDEITLETMAKPRCANRDKEEVSSGDLLRKKRFVPVGSKWHHNEITYA